MFLFDQQTEKNFIKVEHCMSLISKHEDVIPLKIRWRYNSVETQKTLAPLHSTTHSY